VGDVVGAPTNLSSRPSSSNGGSWAGLRDNMSGPSFRTPGTCIVSISQFASWSGHLVSLEFLSFALCSQVNAALSVYSSNRSASRYGLNLFVAQIMAKHPRSTAAYIFAAAGPVFCKHGNHACGYHANDKLIDDGGGLRWEQTIVTSRELTCYYVLSRHGKKV
jgi:hypothetical protein